MKNNGLLNMRNTLLTTILVLFILSSGLFTILSNSSVLASNLVQDSWNTMTPMKQARGLLGVVAAEGKIYAIGGSLATVALRNKSDYMATNECYDPTSNTWVTLTSMPTPRHGFAIATYDGKIYCIGGYGYNESSLIRSSELGINEVYDIAADSWSTKTALPVSGGSLQAQVVEGKIFVIDQLNGTLFMYDPVTDFWTAKTNLPSWGRGLVSAVVDNKIIIKGTFYYSLTEHGVSNDRKVLIYDPKTDTFSEANAGVEVVAHTSAAGATFGLYGSPKLYVFYGGLVTSTLVYDPVTDVWSAISAMPDDRFSFGVAVVDDVFYVIGGFPDLGGAPLSVNERYVPADYRGTLPSETGSSLDNRILVGALVGTVVAVAVAVPLALFQKQRQKEIKKKSDI
jgi:N-acetylneuraminic acid mutarotase